MSNEILLVISLIFIYFSVIGSFVLFGATGLYCWTAIATILANIEVLILVDAFGLEQTLGNILFASTFLVTDILSELYGQERSKKATNIGIYTSIMFIIISQSWLKYTPIESNSIFSSISYIFANTPRMIIVSLLVYAVCQKFDVWFYHKIWNFTKKRTSEDKKYLWLRNNLSTLVSQLVNSFLFNIGAFSGIYNFKTLISMSIATYVVFIITSILDTPFVYLARYIHKNKTPN